MFNELFAQLSSHRDRERNQVTTRQADPAPAKPCGDGAHRVGHAAIDLYPNDQLPAICTTRIIHTDFTAAKQRHSCAEQLAGAHVPVQPLALL